MLKKAISKIKNMFSLEDEEEEYEEAVPEESYRPKREASRPSLISLPNYRNKQEIMILEPSSYAETMQIADYIKQKKILILNLNKTDKDLAHHIISFLQGACYVQDGHIENIAEQIFLFTPCNIDIVSSHKDIKVKENLPFMGNKV
jgi:cell division inhibitor SepF